MFEMTINYKNGGTLVIDLSQSFVDKYINEIWRTKRLHDIFVKNYKIRRLD